MVMTAKGEGMMVNGGLCGLDSSDFRFFHLNIDCNFEEKKEV